MSIFDEIIPRHGTNSVKYDMFDDPDWVIPMPVADMDFRVAPPIYEHLIKIAQHGVYGYSVVPKELPILVQKQLFEKYNWQIAPEWLVWMPGMEVGLTLSAKLWADSEKDILTVSPIYPPFHKAIAYAGKKLYTSALIEKDGRYRLNFEEIERSFANNVGLFLFCNPHNPGGTVYSKTELDTLALLCKQYGVCIVSDEIHCELLLQPTLRHIPIASLHPEIMQNSITMMSPSKTYNIAGLGCSYAIIPNEQLRAKFVKQAAGMWPAISRMGYEAALLAYREGEPWKNELLPYLKRNHDYLYEALNKIPGLKMLANEATYLAWIDAREHPNKNLHEAILAAGVRLMEGHFYLADGFLRLNFACPYSVLQEAVHRIAQAASI